MVQQLQGGVIPPLVTPFTPTHEVDVESAGALSDYMIDSGVAGLFVLGSSGEVSFLSDAQRSEMLRTAVEQGAGRVPVLAGVVDTSFSRVRDHILRAADDGADYAVVTAPFYARVNDRDIVRHFCELAKVSPLPLIAYDIPVAVGSKLSPAVVMRIAEEGAIVAVKDSSGNSGMMRELVLANRDAGSPISIFTGTEVVVDADMLKGVDGVVPGLANVDASAYVQLFNLCREERWLEASRLQERLVRLFEIVTCDRKTTGPAQAIGGFKAAMAHQGIIKHATTAFPSFPLTEEAVAEIHTITQRHFSASAESPVRKETVTSEGQ